MAQYLDKEGLQTALSLVKEYISTKLADKQDTLTVGEGLTLEDNVLSINLDTNIFEYVSSLPDTPEDTNKIYIVLSSSDDADTGNLYEEYYWNTNDSAWEKIGSFTTDFSQYWTYDEDADTLTHNVASAVVATELQTNTITKAYSDKTGNIWNRDSAAVVAFEFTGDGSTYSNIAGCSSEATGTHIARFATNQGSATATTYIGSQSGESGSNTTYIGYNKTTGTTNVVLGHSTTYPIESIKVYTTASDVYGTTTFNSVAYGTTPDSDATSNELVTAEWVNTAISEVQDVVVNLEQTVENNIQSYLNWVEID